mmetsp:Transcript_42070/g.102687  ORF Transcript_42070/g.102687 Transcript_42070/m.102687 type:complete len:228 (-) Transcript_42070:1759-2442(-)
MRTGTVVRAAVSPPGTFGMLNVSVPLLAESVEPASGERELTATCTDVEPCPTVRVMSLAANAGMASYLTVTTVPPSAGPTTGSTERSCVVGRVLWSTHTPPAKHSLLEGGLSPSHRASAVSDDFAQKASKEHGTKYCTGKATMGTPPAAISTCHSMGESMLGLSKTTTDRLPGHETVTMGHVSVCSTPTTFASRVPPRYTVTCETAVSCGKFWMRARTRGLSDTARP